MLSLTLFELTLRDVLSDIPMDAGSAVVLVMMILFVALVWLGSRGGSARPRPDVLDAADAPPVPAPASHSAERAPAADAVVIHPSTLSTATDIRRVHPEVR